MRIIVIIVCVSDVFHLYLIYCYEKEVSSGVIVNRNIFFVDFTYQFTRKMCYNISEVIK